MLTGNHVLNVELLSDQLSVSTTFNLRLGQVARGTRALERGCPPFVLAAFVICCFPWPYCIFLEEQFLGRFLGRASPSLSTDAASAWPLLLPPYYSQETIGRRIFGWTYNGSRYGRGKRFQGEEDRGSDAWAKHFKRRRVWHWKETWGATSLWKQSMYYKRVHL